MAKQNQDTIGQDEQILREEFLEPDELFLLSYLVEFNREIERKWQERGLGNFSKY